MCDIVNWTAVGTVIAAIGIGIAINRWIWDRRILKLEIPKPELIVGERGFRFSVPKRENRYWAVSKIEVADGFGTLHKIREVPGVGPKPYDPPPSTYEQDGRDDVVLIYSPGLIEGIVGITGDVSDVAVTVAEDTEPRFRKAFPFSISSLRSPATR